MRRTLWVIAVFTLLAQAAAGDDKQEVKTMLRNTVGTVLEYLHNEDLCEESKRERIMETINPVFDFALMGKLALGKRYWPKLNEDERKQYIDLFIKQLQNSYYNKLAILSNEKIEYEEPVLVKTKIHVATTVVSKGERTKTLYKCYRSPTGWKVYDVEIQGVSIVSSYRAQYADVLKTGTVEKLLKKMKAKITTDGDDE